MKMNYLKTISFFLFTVFFITGCQKQVKDEILENPEDEKVLQSRGSHGNDDDGCRLTGKFSDYGDETYKYNRKGLLDEYYLSAYDGFFKHEYDRKNRLVKSGLYSGNELVYTIIFHYRDEKVVKEIWYAGQTREKADEVFYQYDRKGKIKKSTSIIGDYTVEFQYTREGNLLKGLLSIGGNLNYSVELTYLHRNKNPFSAIPGLDYDYTYVFGPFYQNKWYSSSEKDIFYDESGNAVVQLDQDPYKTIVKTNRQGFVTRSDFFDKLTQEYAHFRFEYENCGRDGRHKSGTSQQSAPRDDRRINLMKFLKKGTGKSIKEQVKEWRNQSGKSSVK